MTSSLSAAWLGARLGRDPSAVDAARREGRLLGIRAGDHYEYPSWQFDAAGDVLPALPRVIAAARTIRCPLPTQPVPRWARWPAAAPPQLVSP